MCIMVYIYNYMYILDQTLIHMRPTTGPKDRVFFIAGNVSGNGRFAQHLGAPVSLKHTKTI